MLWFRGRRGLRRWDCGEIVVRLSLLWPLSWLWLFLLPGRESGVRLS